MTGAAFPFGDMDFDAAYRGRPIVPGADVAFAVAPWDIHAPQPAVVELERDGQFRGDVLDVGCGLGENAIFLAGKGHRVTGVDGSAAGLEQAARRAAERGVDVTFVHSDVTSLVELDARRFETVLDSALYHCLDEDQRRRYAAALHRVAAPGARLHLLCFADVDEGLRAPIAVSRDDLGANLGAHWNIEDIRPASYTTAMTVDQLTGGNEEAMAGLGFAVDPERVRRDGQGRILARVWQMRATRG
jgi:SAM-dependent methyltransferase